MCVLGAAALALGIEEVDSRYSVFDKYEALTKLAPSFGADRAATMYLFNDRHPVLVVPTLEALAE